MAQRSSRQWIRLTYIFMAGLASAKSLTLSDFESIDSNQVSPGCIKAYDTPLAGCTSNDFMGGKACSAGCKGSVKDTEGYIKASCAGVNSDSDSLLYRGQQGNLVEVLCRDADEAPAQPQQPQARPTSAMGSTLATQVKDNVMIETSTSVLAPASGLPSGSPAVISDFDGLADTSVLAVDVDEPTRSVPSSHSIPAPTSTAPAKETATHKSTSQPGSGGGDPGDFVTSAGSSPMPVLSLVSVMLCVVFFA